MMESLVWGQPLQKAEVQKAGVSTQVAISPSHTLLTSRSWLLPPSTLRQYLQHAGPGRELPQSRGSSWMPEQEVGSLSQALAAMTHSPASDG